MMRASLDNFSAVARLLLILFSMLFLMQAQEIMPLSQVKKGDKGYGLTVFDGDKPEKFNFEVVAIKNNGGGTHYIIVELSGGPKDKNGEEILKKAKILHGMSGSPLFINDKLIGGLSMAPTLSLELKGLVTPAELMTGFRPLTFYLPNKLLYYSRPAIKTWGPDSVQIGPGDMYIFCEYWGDDYSCGGGTVTMADQKDPTLFYTLGHRALLTGATAIPFWKGKVLTNFARLDSSGKIIEEIGPMLGAVILDGPYGQVVKLEAIPKFFSMELNLESYFPAKTSNHYFFAYTPGLNNHISAVVASKRSLIDKLLDLYMEAEVSPIGFRPVRFSGVLTKIAGAGSRVTDVGSVVKLFVSDELEPNIAAVSVTLRARSKYKILDLEKITAETVGITDKDISLQLSIAASGDKNWSRTINMTLDKKYLDKKLYVASGAEIAGQILPTLRPGEGAVELLNKISDRNALYIYYSDDELSKAVVSGGPTFILDLGTSASFKQSEKLSNLSKLTAVPTGNPATATGWKEASREYNLKILNKIELPGSDYLVKGKKDFTLKAPEARLEKNNKKKKKFLVF